MKLQAEPFAVLPSDLHWRGEPNGWVRMTRPGQRLHSFLEGACFDEEGALWLVDVPYGRLFKVEDGRWHVAHEYDGEPHGLAWRDGSLLIADQRRGVLHLDRAIEPLLAGHEGKDFLGLSDLAVGSGGEIWVTDPGRSSLSDPSGRLFLVRDGVATLVLDHIPYPNGVALSPDGRHVYVAVTRANAVWRLAAEWTGIAAPMCGVFLQLSGGLGPDGLAVDATGRIAVAQAQAGRAYLFSADGDKIADIHVEGGSWTTACAFGPDGALYIVEAQAGAVHRCDLGKLL